MKKNRLTLCFLLTILLLLVGVNAYGSGFKLPEPSRYFYVYDEANIIDSYLEDYIINTNEQLYSETGAQIVVATLNSLNGNSEQEIAVQLFRKWGIGSEEKNNGVLILVAPNEKRLWIEVGYGLEGALPDGKVGEIRDKNMFPYFKENDYNTSILKGFDAILSVVANEYDIERPDSSKSQGNYDDYDEYYSTGIGIKPIVIVIGIIIFLFIDFRFFGGMLTMMLLRSSSRRGGFGGGRGGRGGGNRGGGGSSGGGGAGGGW
ncbi:TPM domain-containing protein [Proteiniborus sp. MB09-C3]|uniref:TPM domain-containing protein n=1 Tax=Proteiniborus sp. MB09-C3 TaxID=3050072 RepID=UPI00255447A1|nr:TPM domain-containing protein [Proteiniborus sp. MB09-C3]WIV11317.1 TPM domain-containing protein [Proteiniborus sp. MB09-C3]